jgi:hypothetical protein
LNHFGLERLPSLLGNKDLFDWEAFWFEHSVYSLVIERIEENAFLFDKTESRWYRLSVR